MFWLELPAATAAGMAAGFLIARKIGRGDIVGVLIVLSVPATAISVQPVYSAFDDPLVGDDWHGISAVVLMIWLVIWTDLGLLAGWLRSRHLRRSAT